MCRWLAYSGTPVYLEDLIFLPEHSLIDQSLSARASETTTNGDGFGIGWYADREEPGLYRDIQPAWNDLNLRDLARQIRSGLFFAHVRSATGTPVQQTNCHPFRHGRFLFMHNGEIRGFSKIRRDLMLEVDPDLFSEIQGNTDTELMFYLALTFGLEEDPIAGVERMVGFIEARGREHGIENPVQMTLATSDGERTWAFRYSSEGKAHSLYCSKSVDDLRKLNPRFASLPNEARAVVSEPLTDLSDYWMEFPQSRVAVIERGEVTSRALHPRAP
jgi:predicted glutamine amidotransferase